LVRLLALTVGVIVGLTVGLPVMPRKLLLSPQLKDSLLVLDDVWRAEVIRTFLLPARILVTTQAHTTPHQHQDRLILHVVAGYDYERFW
jgi:hypothetical protein